MASPIFVDHADTTEERSIRAVDIVNGKTWLFGAGTPSFEVLSAGNNANSFLVCSKMGSTAGTSKSHFWGSLDLAAMNNTAVPLFVFVFVYDGNSPGENDVPIAGPLPLRVVFGVNSTGAEFNAMTAAALAQFATVDTGETSPASGSVAWLAQGAGGSPPATIITNNFTGAAETDIDYIKAQVALLSQRVVEVLADGEYSFVRGDQWISNTYDIGLTSAQTTDILFTIRESYDDTDTDDSEALLKVTRDNGLIRLNKSGSGFASTYAEIVHSGTEVTVKIYRPASKEVPSGVHVYDVRSCVDANDVRTTDRGQIEVLPAASQVC